LFNTKLRTALVPKPNIALSLRMFRAEMAICWLVVLAGTVALVAQSTEFEKSFQRGTEATRSGQWEEAAQAFTKATGLFEPRTVALATRPLG